MLYVALIALAGCLWWALWSREWWKELAKNTEHCWWKDSDRRRDQSPILKDDGTQIYEAEAQDDLHAFLESPAGRFHLSKGFQYVCICGKIIRSPEEAATHIANSRAYYEGMRSYR